MDADAILLEHLVDVQADADILAHQGHEHRQLGYIAAICGLVLMVCSFKGYEKFGKKLDMAGIAASVLVAVFIGRYPPRRTGRRPIPSRWRQATR